MRARRDVAAAGCIRAKAPDVHMPQVKARFAFNDPFGQHFADAARTGDAMRAKTTRRPESAQLGRFTQDKLAIRGKRLKTIDFLDQFSILEVGNALKARVEQGVTTRWIVASNRGIGAVGV